MDPLSSHADTDGERSAGVPRWLKILGISVAVIVLLFLAMRLLPGGGLMQHGPAGSESPSTDSGGESGDGHVPPRFGDH